MTHWTTAAPDTVWAVATDLDRAVQVLSGVTEVERLDAGDGYGPGTRWRETRELFGRSASEVLEVTAIDDDARSYVVEADNRGTHYVSTLRVTPSDAGALLRMTLGAETSGLGSRLLARTVGRAFESATRTALEQDLRDIAAAAEADEADHGPVS